MIPLRPRLLTAVFLSACTLLSLLSFTAHIEAKSHRGRAISVRASGKTRVVRVAQRHVRQRLAAEEAPEEATASNYRVVPDKIEVVEYGSARASEVTQFARSITANISPADVVEPARKRSVSIDPTRVAQIQQALAGRGFYQGEISGSYDEATINAMQRFQASQRIPTTGYPTAHALKRLGLGSW